VKHKGTATRVTFKLPINAGARSIVDSEVEKFRNSVIPIIGADDRMRPYLVGSAVALMHRSRKVLVTAEHVLSDNAEMQLFIFGHDRQSRFLDRNFESSGKHDLAAKLLSSEEADVLSHIPFIPENVVGAVAAVGERFYATVVGYPATASKRKDRRTLETPMEAYSNYATAEIDGSISVLFDKKEGAQGKDGHVIVRDPFGKSGGAIFGFPVANMNVRPFESARLVGIGTRWERGDDQIKGAGVVVLSPLLDRLA
jgi:hypothetical protein